MFIIIYQVLKLAFPIISDWSKVRYVKVKKSNCLLKDCVT